MNITDDVVRDLMPLYMAGEASADTVKLVEEYLARHPQLRSAVAEEMPRLEGAVPANLEKRALEHTRRMLARKNNWLGAAIFLTLAPFSFRFGEGGVSAVLYRDWPGVAAAAVALGLAAWGMFLLTLRRLNATGLPAPRSWAVRLGWTAMGYLVGAVVMLVAGQFAPDDWAAMRYLKSGVPILSAWLAVYLGERVHRVATIDELHRPTTLMGE
jgi:anti-sigma factor RsiW